STLFPYTTLFRSSTRRSNVSKLRARTAHCRASAPSVTYGSVSASTAECPRPSESRCAAYSSRKRRRRLGAELTTAEGGGKWEVRGEGEHARKAAVSRGRELPTPH